MSRSNTDPANGNHCSFSTISIAFFVLLTLTSCDGGLFGTGDASDVIDAVDVDSTEAPQAPGADMPINGEPETDNETSTLPSASPGIPLALSFNNTTPSGLSETSTLLPALKVINLSNEAVSAMVSRVLDNGTIADILPGLTSEPLRLDSGETQVTIARVSDNLQLVTIDPLNAVVDSLTTVVLFNEPNDNGGESPFDGEGSIGIRVLDTRANVSAPDMAEVRLVLTGSPGDLSGSSFSLMPQQNDFTGSTLAFAGIDNLSSTTLGYSLANPGTYTLSSATRGVLAQDIDIRANRVYSIIVTNDSETPVYLEVDSLMP